MSSKNQIYQCIEILLFNNQCSTVPAQLTCLRLFLELHKRLLKIHLWHLEKVKISLSHIN